MNTLTPWILFLFWLSGLVLLWKIPFPRRKTSADTRSFECSVIIPARNEERNLGRLLASIQGQTDRPLEVLVVDDASEDRTAEIAQRAGYTVIASGGPPEGWSGKPWACWQGAHLAKGNVFVFLDADTFLELGGLSKIMATYREKRGLLSVQPFHQMEKPYERLAAFFNIVVMAGMGAFTPLGERLRPLGAFGPCMVCGRDDYFAVGGHGRVRGDVIESLNLGKAFLKEKRKVSCYGGKGSISFRMYPEGLCSLVEGFGKGYGTGATAMSIGSLLMLVCWISGGFAVTRHVIQSAVLGNWTEVLAYMVLDGLYVLQVHWMLMRIGNFGFPTALFFQVPLVFFALVFGWSLLRIFFVRKVKWKGRTVNTQRG